MLECTTYTEPSPAPTKDTGNSVTALAEGLDSAFFFAECLQRAVLKC